MSEIKLSPELVRLTRRCAELEELPFTRQAARLVVQQAIIAIDPELGFLLEENESLASINTLVRAAQVNDIVVNGRRLDVALLEDGELSLPLALLSTGYIECGSLVVRMDSAACGSVVGYVPAQSWEAAAKPLAAQATAVQLPFVAQRSFDLSACLQEIERQFAPNLNKPAASGPGAEEVLNFVRDASKLPLSTRRKVIAAALASEQVRESIVALDNFQPDRLPAALRSSAVWESRVARIADRIQQRFPALSPEQIVACVKETGAQFGGQAEAPLFRERLSRRLAREHLSQRASQSVKEALGPITDSIVAGKNAVSSLSAFVKDSFALEVAKVILKKRSALGQFANATAEEIGLAFQQLAPQPAYATHSQSKDGVAAINEALALCEAALIVETLMAIDFD